MKASLVCGWARLPGVIVVMASLGSQAIAADNGAAPTVAYPNGIAQPLPEVAAGGTVVLRGRPLANTNVGEPVSGANNGLPGNYPGTALSQPQGLDTGGWDTSDYDLRFDRSGLSPLR